MSFSDWLTVTSILLAVLLAVFKYDEWEIIRLKNYKKYFWYSSLSLIICGVSAYFSENEHPELLDVFWNELGVQSKLWPIIWMIITIVLSIIGWRNFTGSKPNPDLIKKYEDYLLTYDSSRFSSLFRKYERFFFTSEAVNSWIPYEKILTNMKWWNISISYFGEIIFKDPNRFYEMDQEVLKSLLKAQLLEIPNSHLTNELKSQWNGTKLNETKLNETTPILNIYMSTSFYLSKNILIPTIIDVANEYYASSQFYQTDKLELILSPTNNAIQQIAPKSLTPFFYIEFLNCYWNQVLKTKSKVAGFAVYSTWTKMLLDASPEYKGDNEWEISPNLYITAIEKMSANIGDWIDALDEDVHSDFSWAANDFISLSGELLCEINNKCIKVSDAWFESQNLQYLKGVLKCRQLFGDEINECCYEVDNGFLLRAFTKLTSDKYYTDTKKKDPNYQWLKKWVKTNE